MNSQILLSPGAVSHPSRRPRRTAMQSAFASSVPRGQVAHSGLKISTLFAAPHFGRFWPFSTIALDLWFGRFGGKSRRRPKAPKTMKLTHFIISRAAIAVLHRQARDMLRSNPLGDAVLA